MWVFRFLGRLSRPSDRAKLRISVALYFVVGIALVALPWDHIVVLPSHPELQRSLQRIPIGLGEALIIAQILILLVDSATKRTLLEEFARDVSLHIIGRWLPVELRSHLEEYLASDIIRKNWTIRYNIESYSDHPHFFKLSTESDSEIENRGHLDRAYTFRYEVEESFYPELGNTKIVSCSGHAESRLGRDEIDPDGYDGFDYPFDGKVNLIKDNNSSVVTRTLTIPQGCTFRIKAESEECFRDGSSIPFFTICPTLATQLIVNYAKSALDVYVDLSFGDIESDATYEVTETGDRWVLNKPILPGQGFCVRIYDKKTARPATPTRRRGRKRNKPAGIQLPA